MARKKIDKELNDWQRELVIKNMGYARSIALNYRGRGAETNDLIQEAYLALCEAVLRYDESEGSSVVTFSTLYINGVIARYIMKNVQQSYTTHGERIFIKMLSLDRHVELDEDSVVLADVIDSDYNREMCENEKMAIRIEKLMECLTADEAELIESRFKFNGEGNCLEELRKRKYSNIKICQLYRKCDAVIEKMADYAEKENL